MSKSGFIGFRASEEIIKQVEALRKLVLMPNGKKQNKSQWMELACKEKIERDKENLQLLSKLMNVATVKSNPKQKKEIKVQEICNSIGSKLIEKTAEHIEKTIDVAAIVANHKPKKKEPLITHFGNTKKQP